MSECVYCQNTFEMNETCSDEFRMWQGLVGPYYIPSVDENGVIRWSNNGELPNPDAVNIRGPAGAGLEIKGTADTVGDLPETAEDYDIYLVGTSEPFYGYIYQGGTWTNIGEIGKGEPGEDGVGVPTGGTTGQVLAKASGTNYDTAWVTPVDPATTTPIMDGTAAVGTSAKYAREDHVHPTDTSRASAADVSAKILQASSSFPIPSTSVTKSMSGITANHVLIKWNFSSSAENAPPCDLTWSTANGSFTITKTDGTTSESIQPIFALPTAVAAT